MTPNHLNWKGPRDRLPLMVSLEEAIRGRRSVRRYTDRHVPPAMLDELFDLARHAPSSLGGQPCWFLVLRDPGMRRHLADLKNAHCPPEKRHYPADYLADAPVVVMVGVERARAHGRGRESAILATGTLLLAAHGHGLSGVYLSAYSDGTTLADEMAVLFGLPAEVEPVTLIPLGYPAEEPPPKTLRPLAQLIHHERIDASLLRAD